MTLTTRPDVGELQGYASTFNNVDRGGDVVVAGAFRHVTDAINRGKVSVPIVAAPDCGGHGCSGNPRDVVGAIVEAREDDYGWWVRAEFAADADSQLLRTKVRSGGLSMSIGYDVRPGGEHFGMHNGQRARFLTDLDIGHVALTGSPMNPLARVTGAKWWLSDNSAPSGRPRPDTPEVARARRIAHDLGLNLDESIFETAQYLELDRQLRAEMDRVLVAEAARDLAPMLRRWGLR